MLDSGTEKLSKRGLWHRALDQKHPDGKAVGGGGCDKEHRSCSVAQRFRGGVCPLAEGSYSEPPRLEAWTRCDIQWLDTTR